MNEAILTAVAYITLVGLMSLALVRMIAIVRSIPVPLYERQQQARMRHRI
jgi:hypothetical protein